MASGAATTAARMASAWATQAGVRPAAGAAGAARPVSRRVCLSRRTQDTLTRDLAATAGAAMPASESASTRSRRSIEYARIDGPPATTVHKPARQRYTGSGTALACEGRRPSSGG